MPDDPLNEFHIGLTMSGAISAGAYTAGVFDFLIQALEEWEKARKDGDPANHIPADKIPSLRVGLKVMSGASAGAITAAIGAVALADAKQAPVLFDSPEPDKQKIKCYLPKLYETWVVKPALVAGQNDETDFLSFSDLDTLPGADDFSRTSDSYVSEEVKTAADQPIVSLLNSRLLDEIAGLALNIENIAAPRPYIADNLHIYMTLSNLRGVPYKVVFNGGDYHMISHGDRVHYAISGLGSWTTAGAKSYFADNDQKRMIDTHALVNHHPEKNRWRDYAVCALASAAFPIGLSPRAIGATLGDANPKTGYKEEYTGRIFPLEQLVEEKALRPDWQPSVLDEKPFWFTSSDGGIIDNDPFEYARFSLKRDNQLEEHIDPALEHADRAVIMISPFPELRPIRAEGQPANDIVSIFSALMPSLINQARFKPSELVLAARPDYGSRYLIGPKRVTTSNGKEKLERYAIASGLLGGFGGFVAHTFRDHDFQLGRRNCQMFLRNTFALPSGNACSKTWPDPAAREAFQAKPSKLDEGKKYYPILPLFGTAREDVALPRWPQISQTAFQTLLDRIGGRFDRVAPLLIQHTITGFLGFLLQIPLWPGVRNLPGLMRAKVLEFAKWTILADLVRRDQIEGWDLGDLPARTGMSADDIRFILAELINPAFDERTVQGLLKSTLSAPPTGTEPANVNEEQITNLLAICENAKDKPYEVWRAPWQDKNGKALFTLASRAPSALERLTIQSGLAVSRSGAQRIGDLFTRPKIDPPGF